MKRLDDLLEAATSRFRYDAGLRQEITRELRAHLEDSIAAARAGGMDEAQAEEAAVRAFGDPEEIGEKLWQANRRRLRRRAVVMAAVGVVLMPAVVLGASWFITCLLAKRVGPLAAGIGILAVAAIYLLTRLFLPKTARFGLAYLRWLPTAFGKSIGVIVRNAWIWVPVLPGFALAACWEIILEWQRWTSRPVTLKQWGHNIISYPRLWDSICSILSAIGPSGYLAASLLLYLGYLLFVVRIGKWLQSASGIAPLHARRWHIAFIVGALAGILCVTWRFLFAWILLHGQKYALLLRNPVLSYLIIPPYLNMLLNFASLPFDALISTLFLTIVLRRLRGQSLSLGGVLSSAFIIIGPMVWLFLIWTVGEEALQLLIKLLVFDPKRSPLDGWLFPSLRLAGDFLSLAASFLPVIIVSEQCGLRRACVRFGDFVRLHLWRYVAFIFLAALLLGLPRWAIGAAFGPAAASWSTYVWVTLARWAIQFALQLALTVMCFEFYLTRAGTVAPMAAEEETPQLPSE